jgi:DNA-binding transcriptional MerR regulator
VAPKEEYSRAQVRRKFRLTERQLQSWEKQELIASAEKYSFTDLIAFQTLVKLRQSRIGTREIASALRSLREKLSVKKPLVELKIVNDGRRIRVYVGGQKMEALSGQILLDFDAEELGALRAFPDRKRSVNRTRESEEWFQRGLELEETRAPPERWSTWARSTTGSGASTRQRNTTCGPSKRIRCTRWRSSTWGICSMNRAGGRKPTTITSARWR